jgi:hypothetical protein
LISHASPAIELPRHLNKNGLPLLFSVFGPKDSKGPRHYQRGSQMQECVQNLTRLSLSSCKMEAVPLELKNLRSLASLDMSVNLLQQLPPTLRSLTALSSLNLRKNRLYFLPSVVTSLSSLSDLDVRDNEILYDDSAARIAALPNLDRFQFPSPCPDFSWQFKKARPFLSVSYLHSFPNTAQP